MWSTKITKSKRKRVKSSKKQKSHVLYFNKFPPPVTTPPIKPIPNNKTNANYKSTTHPPSHSIESWNQYLPSLQSRYILDNIIKSHQLHHANPNDSILQTLIIDHIINELIKTTSLLTIPADDYPYRSPSIHINKHLLTFGYIRQHSMEHTFIPTDILSLIFKFYDNSILCPLIDEQMQQFKDEKHEIILPKINLMKGMIFELLMYPQGYHESGYTEMILHMIEFPDNIQYILVRFSLYFMEIDHKRTIMTCLEKGVQEFIDCDLAEIAYWKEFDAMHIECCMDIIQIKYKDNVKEQMGEIEHFEMDPRVEDVRYVWNIEEDLLKKFRTFKELQFHSDYFGNGCFLMNCVPNQWIESKDENEIAFVIHLLKLPQNVKSVTVSARIIGYVDNMRYVTSLNRFEMCPPHFYTDIDLLRLCSSLVLETCMSLSFVVDIEVISINLK